MDVGKNRNLEEQKLEEMDFQIFLKIANLKKIRKKANLENVNVGKF